MKKKFYSNGKLLITGEYLVLDGAKAFALPTKKGQNLIIEDGNNNEIIWKSYDADGSIWFEDTLLFASISSGITDENESVKATLITILHEAYKLNPDFISNSNGYIITTELGFPKSWGLGTSSTLINNIAQWLQIDAFTFIQDAAVDDATDDIGLGRALDAQGERTATAAGHDALRGTGDDG